MVKVKNKKLWLELYDVAQRILKIEPWKELLDSDLFVYNEDDDVNKRLYYCTMGKAGAHKAIAVYNERQINGYFETLKSCIKE